MNSHRKKQQLLLQSLRTKPYAPYWTSRASDQLTTQEVKKVAKFHKLLFKERVAFRQQVPESFFNWAIQQREYTYSFRERLPASNYPDAEWHKVKTTSRDEIASHIEKVMPINVDLKRMAVYRTAGTTGHVLQVPHDHVAVAYYLPMLEFAFTKWQIEFTPNLYDVACFLVGAQKKTATYATMLAAWNHSIFVKLNLNHEQWPTVESTNNFFQEFQPKLITSDPIALSEMLRRKLPCSPKAMISTAVAMSSGLKKNLMAQYNCPVIEWYSLTETGPIGYYCPDGNGYHVLPHDIFVEVLNKDDQPVAEGELGEITITGGRNPYLPLLRYRTGDWGRIEYGPCSCGDHMPRIIDLEGRSPVLFLDSKGKSVNSVDISRLLRKFPIVQYQVKQHSDRSYDIILRQISEDCPIDCNSLKHKLKQLLGDVCITIISDSKLGDRKTGDKVIPYHSELLLED